MRERFNVFMFCGLMLVGCSEFDPDPNNPKDVCPSSQIDMPTFCPNLDLATPAPKCAAAKGLSGDTLHCVDFKMLTDQTLTGKPAVLADWDFDLKGCWEIATGKLQVKNFGTFVGTCSFTMPLTDLAAAANQKYQSVTLAVVQRVDLNALPASLQTEQVYFGVTTPGREFSVTTGKTPRQHNVYEITRTDLGQVFGVGTSFQPVVQVSGTMASPGNTGVQTESIAVMGNP